MGEKDETILFSVESGEFKKVQISKSKKQIR